MQQKRRREGLIRSDRSFEPKRYIQTAVGFIARVGRNRVIVANGASRPRRIDLSPRTIVCRAGHPVPRKRELVVGAAARVLLLLARGMGTSAAAEKGTRKGVASEGSWAVVKGDAAGGPRPPEGGRGEHVCVRQCAGEVTRLTTGVFSLAVAG